MAIDIWSYDNSVVRWVPLSHAEFYEVQASREPVVNDFTSVYKGKKDFCLYPPKLIGGVRFRVRGRVEGKWSLWSKEYLHVFALYVSVNFSFRNGLIMWQSDPFSEISEVQISKKNADNFSLIFSGTGTSLLHMPTLGEWTFRIRNSRGNIYSEWVYLDVYVDNRFKTSNSKNDCVFTDYYMRKDSEMNAFGVKREIGVC